MPPSNLVTAADYADAMMIARRAKNWVFLLLLLMLLGQIGIFFAARLTNTVFPETQAEKSLADKMILPATLPTTAPVSATAAGATAPTTAPATQATDPAKEAKQAHLLREVLWYLTAGVDYLGIVLGFVLGVCLLLIVNIMLVGRLVGVAQVTSAWVWCLLLVLMLFPWQSFMADTFTNDFKIPGVLYTWSELTHPTMGAKFGKLSEMGMEQAILRWARFVVWPGVAVILLLVIQAKSSRGLRAALGETELDGGSEVVS